MDGLQVLIPRFWADVWLFNYFFTNLLTATNSFPEYIFTM